MQTKKKVIGSVIILVVLCAIFIIGAIINKPKEHKFSEEDIFVDSSNLKESGKTADKLISVYINGEISKPGVYKLKAGSIVEDLIKQAGGYTVEANTGSKLNLARKLKDEDYIYVERKPELTTLGNSIPASTSTASNEKININSAGLSELDKIPGVGPITAQKIIDYREKHGAFTSIEDLKKIGGMGDKTIDKFRDMVDIR